MASTNNNDERQRLLSTPQVDNGTIPAPPEAPDPAATTTTTTTIPAKAWHESLTTSQLMLMFTGPFIGGFLAAVDSTLVGTLGGAISSSLGDLRLLSWLGSSFFIATCVSQPIIGKITDIYGRKPVLLCAFVIFCLGNLMCALTRTEGALLAGRVVAGLGGGCIGPITSFVMSDIIPLRRRGVWQGAGNICYGIGSGIGGPLGGWVLQAFDWRWAFAFQVPVTVVAILLIVLTLPETAPAILGSKNDILNGNGTNSGTNSTNSIGTKSSSSSLTKLRRVDFLGSLTLATFLVLLLLGLNSGGSILPWRHPLILASLLASLLFLALFVFIERRIATEPILELRLFRSRTLTAAWLTNWFASMARFGLLFYAPLLFQAQGFSVRDTGLRFVPESAAIVVASISAGAVMRATGRHYWLGIGVVATQIAGLTLICTLTARPLDAIPRVPAWTAFVFLFLNGFGFSGLLTTTLIAMIAAAEQGWQAVITSTSYAFRSTGSVIGITVASAVFQNSLRLMILGASGLTEGDGQGAAVDRERLLAGVQRDLHYMDRLGQPLQARVRGLYIAALRNAFFALLALAVLALVAMALIREHKLHSRVSRRD